MKQLQSPSDLGLPPKYQSWRPQQIDGIQFVRNAKRRIQGLVIPTGGGKTGCAFALAKLELLDNPDARILILTETKGLQAIYAEEGEQMKPAGLVANISGAGNYDCIELMPGGRYEDLANSRNLRARCDNGPCNAGLRCKLRDRGCTFYGTDGALQRARDASIVITNYANWLSAADVAEKEEKFGEFSLIIADEAHSVADAVCSALAVELDLRDVAHLAIADLRQSFAAWTVWCSRLQSKLELELAELQTDIKTAKASGRGVTAKLLTDLRRMQRISRSVARVAGARGEWVTVVTGTKIAFKPVWPEQYCESHLLRGVRKAVFMSATLVPQTLRYLGLKDSDFDFMEMESSFPPERRPVYIMPVAHMKWDKPEEEPKMIAGLDAICKTRPDWRGLVHTFSYGRARTIKSQSKQAQRMVDHTSDTTAATVKWFKKQSPPGTVLVSPAIATGYDFPFDESRFQVIPKIPLSDGRDPVMKARIARDKKYLYYAAMTAIAQEIGRICRAEDDYGETWIIDATWVIWFYEAAKEFMPKYIEPAIKRVSGIGRAPKL